MSGNIRKFRIDDFRLLIDDGRLQLFFLFFWGSFISCAKPNPEPQVNIKIAYSKIVINDRPVYDLDSVTAQSSFLSEKLYHILVAEKNSIQKYRDSVVNEVDVQVPIEENTEQSLKFRVRKAIIDSIHDQPYSATLYSQVQVTYQTFTKLAYTVFQAGFERLYFSDSSSQPTARAFISQQAAQCSPFVSSLFGRKQEFKKIKLSELNQVELLNEREPDEQIGNGVKDSQRRFDHVLLPGGVRLNGSMKVLVEVIPSGMNVKIETFKAKDDQIESDHFVLINEHKTETIPNISDERDWDGLTNIIKEIVQRLKKNKNELYCERVITISLPPDASYDVFCKTAIVIQSIAFDDSKQADPWYSEIVPALYYN
ncbi:hypothetical protein JNM05_08265 [bacterium]|nr:hypothetical protein [bacterium]